MDETNLPTWDEVQQALRPRTQHTLYTRAREGWVESLDLRLEHPPHKQGQYQESGEQIVLHFGFHLTDPEGKTITVGVHLTTTLDSVGTSGNPADQVTRAFFFEGEGRAWEAARQLHRQHYPTER